MMKSTILLAAVGLCTLIALPVGAAPPDCDTAPVGEGGDWARDYKSWCEGCGGTWDRSTQSCDAGSNWGGNRSAPSYDDQAVRRRQQAERRAREEAAREAQRQREAQQQREEAEAKRRAAEAEERRQEALHRMKGITENELGIRGGGEDLRLKDDAASGGPAIREPTSSSTPKGKPVCQWGDLGAFVVDLRCLGLDPNRPVAVDPNVARGKERLFPAQVDPATFQNAQYNRGFAALMRFDIDSAAEAITHFEAARKERPQDPLVRNALLLARDIHKGRVEKQKSDQREASLLTLQSYAALMVGDNGTARTYAAQAAQIDPANATSRFVASMAAVEMKQPVDEKRSSAYKLVGNALYAVRRQEFGAAITSLETARRLQPSDWFIDTLWSELRKYQSPRPETP